MRKILIVALLLAATGCSSVPADVTESIGILRDNTHSLSAHYSSLIERAGAPPAPEAPIGETPEDAEKRLDKATKDWARYKRHKQLLMSANNTLADKVYTWAEVSQEEEEEEEEDTPSEENSDDD